MQPIRLQVEPDVLMDAIVKSGKDMEAVRERFSGLDGWLRQERDPTFNQLQALSGFLRVPIGYLLIRTPHQEHVPLLDYRTIDTEALEHPSRELIDTIGDMEHKQAWLREAYIEEGRGKLPFVGSMHTDQGADPLTVVDAIRERFQLDKKWYEAAGSRTSTYDLLREKLTAQGVVIMQSDVALNNTHRPLDIEEFRAFTLIDDYAPLIFVNAKDSESGKAFALAHEAAHIFFAQHSLYNHDLTPQNVYHNPLELMSHQIAFELVTPTDMFREKWIADEADNAKGKMTHVSDDLKASPILIARKAWEHDFIGQAEFEEVVHIIQKAFAASQPPNNGGGGDPVNNALTRLDRNFLMNVIASAESGRIPYTDAYRLAGVGRGIFEDVADRMKGVR